MRAETAVFASHPPPALLRTAPVASKPASIKAFQASYQLASPLGKRKSGLIPISLLQLVSFAATLVVRLNDCQLPSETLEAQ
jgi:hypothetical protein